MVDHEQHIINQQILRMLEEICYELNIIDENNEYIERQDRDLIIEEEETKLNAETYKNPGKYKPETRNNYEEEDEELVK